MTCIPFTLSSGQVLTSDISIINMTKDNFSSEVYKDKAERIFFWICFWTTIAYARSLMLVSTYGLMSNTLLHFCVLPLVLACVYFATEVLMLVVSWLNVRELKQATFLSTRTAAGSKLRRYRWRMMASAVLV